MEKLLIIDDDHDLYALLCKLLAPSGFDCAHAPDGNTGVAMFASGKYDVIILDVMLPGMDGMQVLRHIREHDTTTPILMLTARGAEDDLVAGLEAGADDYLAKPFRSKELTARLQALLRRSANAADASSRSKDIIESGDLVLRRSSRSVAVNGTSLTISTLEFKLLESLASSPGTVVSRQDLYQLLFGRKAFIEDRGLEMLISRLRRKIGPTPDGQDRIRAVRGEGYFWVGVEQ